MDRLADIEWEKVSNALQYEIYGCPKVAQRDLMRMWRNLQEISKEISKLEVIERRTMGSSGRNADEKLEELLNGIKHLEQMTMIAHLTQS